MTSDGGRDDVWNATSDVIDGVNSTGHLVNDTDIRQRAPGVHVFRDPSMEKLFWKVGVIFVISALIIVGSFVALFGFSYTRRRFSFRRYRRRHQPHHVLAFENQLHVTGDEAPEVTRSREDDRVAVHQSCSGRLRRWSRDDDGDDAPRPRSRSNSRSRSLSPGSGRRSKVAQRSGQHELDDDLINKGLQRLEKARLAFKEDSTQYTEYDSTKDRTDLEI